MTAQPPLDPAPLGFRPLARGDLPLLHRWLNTPHVHRWWASDGSPQTSEAVAAEYGPQTTGEEPTAGFLICYGDTPIGFIQWYYLRDYPDYAAQIGVEGAAGIDLFIGEEAYVHRGLGTHILRMFLRDVIFAAPGVRACVIGPDETNTAAIRAYEKAGFRYLKTISVPGEPRPEYLMLLARAD